MAKGRRDKNDVILEGNICQDPKFKAFESGAIKVTFRLAVSNNYVNRAGVEVKNPMYIDVIRTMKKEEEAHMEAILVKGAPVRVEGRLNQRTYDATDGTKRVVFEVVGFAVTKRTLSGRQGALRPPTSHTTVRTVPYTAVPVVQCFGNVVACGPLSTQPYLADSVRYFRLQGPLARNLLRPTEIPSRASQQVRPFAGWLLRLLRPRLTSARPSRRLLPVVAHQADGQTSQGKTRNLHPIYPPHILPPFRVTIGLRISWPPRPGAVASYAVPVRRAGTLPAASFRPRLAAAALAVRLTVPVTKVRRGLSPPGHQVRYLRGPDSARHGAARHAWRTEQKGQAAA